MPGLEGAICAELHLLIYLVPVSCDGDRITSRAPWARLSDIMTVKNDSWVEEWFMNTAEALFGVLFEFYGEIIAVESPRSWEICGTRLFSSLRDWLGVLEGLEM